VNFSVTFSLVKENKPFWQRTPFFKLLALSSTSPSSLFFSFLAQFSQHKMRPFFSRWRRPTEMLSRSFPSFFFFRLRCGSRPSSSSNVHHAVVSLSSIGQEPSGLFSFLMSKNKISVTLSFPRPSGVEIASSSPPPPQLLWFELTLFSRIRESTALFPSPLVPDE